MCYKEESINLSDYGKSSFLGYSDTWWPVGSIETFRLEFDP